MVIYNNAFRNFIIQDIWTSTFSYFISKFHSISRFDLTGSMFSVNVIFQTKHTLIIIIHSWRKHAIFFHGNTCWSRHRSAMEEKKNNRSYFSLRLCHEFAVVVGSHVLLEEITDQSGPFSLFF